MAQVREHLAQAREHLAQVRELLAQIREHIAQVRGRNPTEKGQHDGQDLDISSKGRSMNSLSQARGECVDSLGAQPYILNLEAHLLLQSPPAFPEHSCSPKSTSALRKLLRSHNSPTPPKLPCSPKALLLSNLHYSPKAPLLLESSTALRELYCSPALLLLSGHVSD